MGSFQLRIIEIIESHSAKRSTYSTRWSRDEKSEDRYNKLIRSLHWAGEVLCEVTCLMETSSHDKIESQKSSIFQTVSLLSCMLDHSAVRTAAAVLLKLLLTVFKIVCLIMIRRLVSDLNSILFGDSQSTDIKLINQSSLSISLSRDKSDSIFQLTAKSQFVTLNIKWNFFQKLIIQFPNWEACLRISSVWFWFLTCVWIISIKFEMQDQWEAWSDH